MEPAVGPALAEQGESVVEPALAVAAVAAEAAVLQQRAALEELMASGGRAAAVAVAVAVQLSGCRCPGALCTAP